VWRVSPPRYLLLWKALPLAPNYMSRKMKPQVVPFPAKKKEQKPSCARLEKLQKAHEEVSKVKAELEAEMMEERMRITRHLLGEGEHDKQKRA
jgi:hypothetical protein